jgi:hypothetical protein
MLSLSAGASLGGFRYRPIPSSVSQLSNPVCLFDRLRTLHRMISERSVIFLSGRRSADRHGAGHDSGLDWLDLPHPGHPSSGCLETPSRGRTKLMTTLPMFEDHRRPIRRKIRSIRSVNDDDSSVAILVGGSTQSVMSCQPGGPAQSRSMRAPRSRSPGSREFVQFRFLVGIDRGIQFRIELSHARRHAHIVSAQIRASCGSIRTLFRSLEQVSGVPVYHRQSSNDLESPIFFQR